MGKYSTVQKKSPFDDVYFLLLRNFSSILFISIWISPFFYFFVFCCFLVWSLSCWKSDWSRYYCWFYHCYFYFTSDFSLFFLISQGIKNSYYSFLFSILVDFCFHAAFMMSLFEFFFSLNSPLSLVACEWAKKERVAFSFCSSVWYAHVKAKKSWSLWGRKKNEKKKRMYYLTSSRCHSLLFNR